MSSIMSAASCTVVIFSAPASGGAKGVCVRARPRAVSWVRRPGGSVLEAGRTAAARPADRGPAAAPLHAPPVWGLRVGSEKRGRKDGAGEEGAGAAGGSSSSQTASELEF